MLNLHELKEVISMMNESHIQKLYVEHDGTKVLIDKTNHPLSESVIQPKKEMEALPQEKTVEPVLKTEEKDTSAAPQDQIHQIVSPMVGTFYSRPDEGSEPYIKIGDIVDEGKVVCLIEAMKLFNEVESEIKGEVVEVLVKDGQVVEYGQALFLIKQD
ncbi:acetyl-CoA carboxylase biotin carboxyl carrier protein [Bacillus sp. 03113]|uniref:acetyl-CoA carboxylase biotin carboxyl carrier protein n=1 Tax=Bacillus sp. 03113 TaxID=2578211 RepID=UPI0011418E7F|nr:acetyl-CoA carboxylase biotin carboxyl carrier protein [Bacillus sp. 03113]